MFILRMKQKLEKLSLTTNFLDWEQEQFQD